MRVIKRVLGELVGVILTGFFVDVATLLAGAIGELFVALFCGAGWFFTHKQHELVNADGFLVEAAVPFTPLVVASYYRDKLARTLAARRAR